jgi:hypothetical protein
MTGNEYPTVRLTRTSDGYAACDGKYRIVRDTCSDISSSNAGCYKACWHVYRGDVRIAKFLDTLREARAEVACDIELWFGGDTGDIGTNN